MPQNNNSQSGNVFLIILISIVLFAALLYSFTRSSQTGTGNLSAQQAKIAAQEILNYARLVEGAVNRVRQNGCSESDISFSNPEKWGAGTESDYQHSPVSEDKCKIFSPEGGNLGWMTPNESWYDQAITSCCGPRGLWHFGGNNRVIGLGTDTIGPPCKGCELITSLLPLKEEVCSAINKELGLGSNIPVDLDNFDNQNDYSRFSGAADFARTDDIPISDKQGMCFLEQTGNQRYIFYYTLIVR